jgi:hypothetical protein
MFISCTNTTDNSHIFDRFHTSYAKADFITMDELLSKDFVCLDEKGEVSFTKSSYIKYMAEWNQVFNTQWNVVSIQEQDNLIISIEHDSDLFNDFFYGGVKPLTEYTYTFSNNKIKAITTRPILDGIAADSIFQNRFTKFCVWVQKNYPDKERYCYLYDKIAATEVQKLLKEYITSLGENTL